MQRRQSGFTLQVAGSGSVEAVAWLNASTVIQKGPYRRTGSTRRGLPNEIREAPSSSFQGCSADRLYNPTLHTGGYPQETLELPSSTRRELFHRNILAQLAECQWCVRDPERTSSLRVFCISFYFVFSIYSRITFLKICLPESKYVDTQYVYRVPQEKVPIFLIIVVDLLKL